MAAEATPGDAQAAATPASEGAQPHQVLQAEQATVAEAAGPSLSNGRANRETRCASQASGEPPASPVIVTRETGARPRVPVPAQQRDQQTQVLPLLNTMPRSIILLPEPYPNWRERLVGLFRALTPEEEAGRPIPGYVGQVYIQRPRAESYLVSAKYDVPARGGSGIRWMRVVEALIRGMRLDLQRHPITFEPLPVKKTEKATCGIRVAVALKPLSLAHSGQ